MEQAAASMPAAQPYWVSFTQNRKFRRLHRTGACWLEPGKDVKVFLLHDSLDGVLFDAKRRWCWKHELPQAPPEQAEPLAQGHGSGSDLEEDEISSSEQSDGILPRTEAPHAGQHTEDPGSEEFLLL